jgi:hypothetical protein
MADGRRASRPALNASMADTDCIRGRRRSYVSNDERIESDRSPRAPRRAPVLPGGEACPQKSSFGRQIRIDLTKRPYGGTDD